jgi:hypothetical protein
MRLPALRRFVLDQAAFFLHVLEETLEFGFDRGCFRR